MTLFEIHPSSRKKGYTWEHILTTLYGLLAGFAILILFMFVMTGGRRGSNEITREMTITYQHYIFVEHLEVTALICAGFACLFNLNAWRRNSQQRYIAKINYDERNETLCFGMLNVYSNKLKEYTIPAKDLEFNNHGEFDSSGSRNKYIKFMDRPTRTEFGRIDPDHEIYAGCKIEIAKAMRQLITIKQFAQPA